MNDKEDIKIVGEESFYAKDWETVKVDNQKLSINTLHRLVAVEDIEDPSKVYIMHEEWPVCSIEGVEDFNKWLLEGTEKNNKEE